MKYLMLIALIFSGCTVSSDLKQINADLDATNIKLKCLVKLEKLNPYWILKESKCPNPVQRSCIDRFIDEWEDNCIKQERENGN